MTKLQVIHPFPARMAPEIVRTAVAELEPGTRFLDPMCGSGVTARLAVEHGMKVNGFDIDPLATLMSRVWVSRIDIARFLVDAVAVAEEAAADESDVEPLPWQDEETWQYIEYWFGSEQIAKLVPLARAIFNCKTRSREALMIALSRIIVTKDRGASLARDVSHSRPHRSFKSNSYDVTSGFLASARAMAKRLDPGAITGTAEISEGDCRSLSRVEKESIDCVVTSPPYLNALDYIRGHRLSLVWLGYSLAALRPIRSGSVGAERGKQGFTVDVEEYVERVGDGDRLFPSRCVGWVQRYAADAASITGELRRVVRPKGKVVLVVGNSFIRGYKVDNARIFQDGLLHVGFGDVRRVERLIPAQHRYLPPPEGQSALSGRMRSEVVLTAIAQ